MIMCNCCSAAAAVAADPIRFAYRFVSAFKRDNLSPRDSVAPSQLSQVNKSPILLTGPAIKFKRPIIISMIIVTIMISFL